MTGDLYRLSKAENKRSAGTEEFIAEIRKNLEKSL